MEALNQWRFTLPLYGVTNKGAINVNWYRNAHHRASNDAKKAFKAAIADQLNCLDPVTGTFRVKYTYFAARNNSPDLDNFVGTVKKFFQDAMVETGFLPEDNVNVIVANSESYGGIDKDNPRVEAIVTQITNNT